MKTRHKGIYAALTSAFFLGMAPIFGKQAILFGLPPLQVVALRTILAAGLLSVLMVIFYRKYLYIYPVGLIGCLLAGAINGMGSIFYYNALGRLDASVAQLLYSLYPLFLMFWLSLDHQPPSRLTLIRLILVVPAIFFLTQNKGAQVDFVGVVYILIAASLYALHLPINQRVLTDMPAQTVTLYTLLAMSAVVIPVYLLSELGNQNQLFPLNYQRINEYYISNNTFAWFALIALTLTTFFSRLTLFVGVKHLGGMQTAILGLSELLITLLLANLWLGEHFSNQQWLGAGLLILSLILVIWEKSQYKRTIARGFLNWLQPAQIRSNTWNPHD